MGGTDVVTSALLETLEELGTVDLGVSGVAPLRPKLAAGRYVPGRTVGVGAFGEVVEAFDQDLRRRVAVKRLRDPSAVRHAVRLVEEAQITAQLDHPTIPSVHSMGVDAEGRAFFAMDFIEGSSLAQILESITSDEAASDDWDERRLLGACVQVGYALAFAHEHGVLHRDVKPENVMVGRLGQVRLMDWGIAKVLNMPGRDARLHGADSDGDAIETTTQRAETKAGTILGTPGYMSPEQAQGRVDIDARADVWALGALIYTVVAGRGPVRGSTGTEILVRTVAGELDALRDLCPETAPALCAITDKALAKDPQRRYSTALELVRDLEGHLAGLPVQAYNEGLLAKMDRYYLRKHPDLAKLRFVHIDTIAVGCLMVGIAMGAWGASHFLPYAWVILVVGVLLWIPFLRAWFRKEPEDRDA